MKFQPTPSTTSATQKCQIAMPDTATATQTAINSAPATMTLSAPKRLISEPVKKPGAYMPTTCHSMTNAAALKGCPQKPIANGVAVISRFMIP